MDEETLLRIHGSGYIEAIKNDAQVVMASFNSWNGVKLHGQKYLLTDVLKEIWDLMDLLLEIITDNGSARMFCQSCPQSINAGVDMFMVTEAWQDLYFNTISQVQTGEISMGRIDDAVRRILRVKARAGNTRCQKPSKRKHALQSDILGADEHRSISRQAVRESLVLLKNNQSVLPIDRSSNVLVLVKQQKNQISNRWMVNDMARQ
ncbi:MAG: hypothetical protein Ct9H90mP13_13730 [Pseudomonadota bacterium]|nr:MAG: hypothetical protein Ct9H90mP13_13730 [Pseudomonadota bacterium]